MEIRELKSEEFDKFASNYPISSMYQTSEYGSVMENQGYEVLRLGFFNDTADLCAASLILIEKLNKFKYAYAPRGFLIDYTDKNLLKDFTDKMKKYLKSINVMAIKICPLIAKSKYTPSLNITLANPAFENIFNLLKGMKYYHLGYNNFFESFKPRFVAVANLEPDINAMFAKLTTDVQSKIRMCDLAGVRIYKGNENNLGFIHNQMPDKTPKSLDYVNDMYKLFNANGKVEVFFAQLDSKIFLVNTQVEYQKQINVCNTVTAQIFQNQGNANGELVNMKIREDNKLSELKNQLVYATNMLRSYPNGIIIASAMVVKQKDQVYLTLEGYDEQYKHLCAKHLLIWKLMEKYSQEGYKELNLGGITNPQSNDERYKSDTDFKLSFNASCIEYAGDFELITNYPLYTLYRNGAPLRKILKK